MTNRFIIIPIICREKSWSGLLIGLKLIKFILIQHTHVHCTPYDGIIRIILIGAVKKNKYKTVTKQTNVL